MFSNGIEGTIILIAVALWFAQGWYLNSRLERVHAKLDSTLATLDGLRRYLYENDPQFDDERQTAARLSNAEGIFAGMDNYTLIEAKKNAGRRTLDTPFV